MKRAFLIALFVCGLYSIAVATVAWNGSMEIKGNLTVDGTCTGCGGLSIISDQTLGSAASTVTFASVGNYPNLRLVMSGRNSAANTDDSVYCEVSGDTTTSHYQNGFLVGTGSGAASGTANNPACGQFPGTSTSANEAAVVEVVFPNYAGTTFFHGAIVTSGYKTSTGSAYQEFEKFWDWQSTAAITSITLTMAGGENFVAGSRFTLYGF